MRNINMRIFEYKVRGQNGHDFILLASEELNERIQFRLSKRYSLSEFVDVIEITDQPAYLIDLQNTFYVKSSLEIILPVTKSFKFEDMLV